VCPACLLNSTRLSAAAGRLSGDEEEEGEQYGG
jgi:hypothetical protein